MKYPFCIDTPISDREHRFFSEFAKELTKKSYDSALEFVRNSPMNVLSAIREDENPAGLKFGKKLCARRLAQELSIVRTTMKRRLRLLAHLSIIKVIYNGPGQRPDVEINPRVVELIDAKREKPTAKKIQEVCQELAALVATRENPFEDLQGFWSNVAFGAQEENRIENQAPPKSMYEEATSTAAQEKAQAQRERFREIKIADEFVRRSGILWMRGQVETGRMPARNPMPPTWYDRDVKMLTEDGRKKYNTLKSLFLRYGTLHVGLAWYAFNFSSEKTSTFEDGKKRPYIHWVSADKNPAAFDKHIMAVFSDGWFDEMLANGNVRKMIRDAYGDELMSFRGSNNLPIPELRT